MGLFGEVVRVALNEEQIEELGLPENPAPQKLDDDPRSKKFIELHGELRQVEVDAIEPHVLRDLLRAELAARWDQGIYEAVRERARGDQPVPGAGRSRSLEEAQRVAEPRRSASS